MTTNPSFVLRNIYEKNILMPIRANSTSNDPILLNDVAATIWKIASEHQHRAELLDEIAQIYELKIESAELSAVDNFISQMMDMGLLLDPPQEV